MATTTANLNLVKPSYSDVADIGVMNGNLDIIDSAFLDRLYPVGSIYMSVSSADPGTLFGGTWERISGKFLLTATDEGSSGAEQAAGNTGGSATVTLTTAQIPSHKHSVGAHKHTVPQHGHENTISYSVNSSGYVQNGITGGSHSHKLKYGGNRFQDASGGSYEVGSGSLEASETTVSATHTHNLPNHTHTLTKSGSVSDKAAFDTNDSTAFDSGASGSGGAHDNMPPYLSVYCWKRIA